MGSAYLYAQPCQLQFKNGVDCQIVVSISLNCPGMNVPPINGTVIQGNWDAPTITNLGGVDPLYCSTICNIPPQNLCWTVTLNGQNFTPKWLPVLPGDYEDPKKAEIFCCNPPNPDICVQNNCGELFIYCNANGIITLELRKPKKCIEPQP